MEDLFGLVTTEAMAFGLPVITSIYSGGREFIQEGHNGYVCDPADIDSIVDSLRKISAKPEMLRQMGENSRELISDCTHERVMQRMGADLIQELEQDERAHYGALASIQFQAGAR
jgi:UDP-glucose:(heptosyl)LPS alpha-1,3-glucosyltransferase